MKWMKLFFSLLAAVMLLLGCALAEKPLGQAVPDFTVATIDGGSFTLSKALKEYDAVLINLWATWCPPCRQEFPYLQAAYEQYKDRVAVIALSIESTDTPDVLRKFAAEYGLTFPIGRDEGETLCAFSQETSIPTSLVVDRFGNVGYVESSSMPSVRSFTGLFDYFISDSYTATAPITSVPASRAGADEAALSEALAAPDSGLCFRLPDDLSVWPMTVAQDGERTAAAAFKDGIALGADAGVEASVTARAGDALAFDFRADTLPGMDYLYITVDGETVKRFSGLHGWTAWAVPLTAGAHTVGFGYHVGYPGGDGDNAVWLDNARLVSGAEAEALLASLPAAPAAEAFAAALTDPDAREIVFDDPAGFMRYYFDTDRAWIVGGGDAHVRVTLTAEQDPGAAFVYQSAQPDFLSLTPEADGYSLVLPLEAADERGFAVTPLGVYAGGREDELNAGISLVLYPDEAAVKSTLRAIRDGYGLKITWSYAQADADAPLPAEAVYTVRVTDENGQPVPGCIVGFCTDTVCMPVMTDAQGVAAFTGAPAAYHLQIVKAPAGYTAAGDLYADPRGGEYTLTLAQMQ